MERKVKYSYEFKLRCIKEVLDQHYSVNSVAKRNGVDHKSVDLWLSFYQKYGKLGLLPRKNKTYSVDFKLKVLKRIKAKSLALSEACLEFNIPTKSIIIKWQKDFITFGIEGLQPKPKGRPKSMSNFKRKKSKSDKPLTREEELLLENEALRCELDVLKKFQALIQAEEKAKKRKS
jgi:transposase